MQSWRRVDHANAPGSGLLYATTPGRSLGVGYLLVLVLVQPRLHCGNTIASWGRQREEARAFLGRLDGVMEEASVATIMVLMMDGLLGTWVGEC